MGRNIWWWFRECRVPASNIEHRLTVYYVAHLLVPIGHSLSDGKTYPVNPRFDSDGRWRRRAEWPPRLR